VEKERKIREEIHPFPIDRLLHLSVDSRKRMTTSHEEFFPLRKREFFGKLWTSLPS
jgi:hypothetical protein